MAFTTQLFLFYFLPAVLLLYHAVPLSMRAFGIREERVTVARNAILLLASYAFYGWWEPRFIQLLFFVTAIHYACGLLVAHPAVSPRLRFWALAATVFLSLGTLGYFKYFAFFQMNLNHVLGWLGAEGARVLRVALPVGISFYTFKAISYSIDVYRGRSPPAKSCLDFACFVSLFPELLAGPISRHGALAGQLALRSPTWERFSSGAVLFVLGFGKKILLADPVGDVADAAFDAHSLTAAQAWLGAAAYAFQVYFDFSGYSDMAVGLGRMLALEIMKNFDSPYLSESITEFWRRWHISLSSFLRDYLYIPLGGNRRGPRRTHANLMAVMLLGGLWHGAGWTFVAWGGYHGALLALERCLGKQTIYHRLPRALRIGATFILVLFSWVLFRSESLEQSLAYLAAMLGWGAAGSGALFVGVQMYAPGALACFLACALLVFSRRQAYDWAESVTWPKALAAAGIFGLALMAMFARSFNQFIYFQF